MSQDPSRDISGTRRNSELVGNTLKTMRLSSGYFALKFDEEQSLITETTEKLDFINLILP